MQNSVHVCRARAQPGEQVPVGPDRPHP